MDGQVALQPIEDNQAAQHSKHADHLLHLQRDILEMVARNAEYKLEVEITESFVIRNGSEVMDELKKLEGFGVSIAMDDFGTGQSSLAQLKHLPISKLKIDSSFVRDISENTDDKAIARTIIAMGHTLGLKVVAEGVETKVQHDFLRDEHCNQLQGYLLAHPLPAEELKNLLSLELATVH